MLVPTENTNYSTFFYLLKKKIEDKKNEIDTLNKEVQTSLSELDGKKKEQEEFTKKEG